MSLTKYQGREMWQQTGGGGGAKSKQYIQGLQQQTSQLRSAQISSDQLNYPTERMMKCIPHVIIHILLAALWIPMIVLFGRPTDLVPPHRAFYLYDGEEEINVSSHVYDARTESKV